LNKNADKEYSIAVFKRLNQKDKLSLIQINGVQNRSMFEHNKTFGVSYELGYICS